MLGGLLVLVVSLGAYLSYRTAGRVMKEEEGQGPRSVALKLSGRGGRDSDWLGGVGLWDGQ